MAKSACIVCWMVLRESRINLSCSSFILNVGSETASAVVQSQVSGVFTEALDLRVCERETICEDLETVLIHHRSPSVSKRIRNT